MVKPGQIAHLWCVMTLRAGAGIKDWIKRFMTKKKISEKNDFFQKSFYLENYQKKNKKNWIFGIYWILQQKHYMRNTPHFALFHHTQNDHQNANNVKNRKYTT